MNNLLPVELEPIDNYTYGDLFSLSLKLQLQPVDDKIQLYSRIKEFLKSPEWQIMRGKIQPKTWLRVYKNKSIDQIEKSIERRSKGNQHFNDVFTLMLNRETLYFDDYFVFYHLYTCSSILYDVQTVLFSYAYDIPLDRNMVLPRFFRKIYNRFKTTDDVSKYIQATFDGDHDDDVRNALMSVACSLDPDDDIGPEVNPMKNFNRGYITCDINYIPLLKKILVKCGSDDPDKLLLEIVSALTSYKVSDAYLNDGNFGYYNENNGQMIQIFVKKNFVDLIAYDSLPYGNPTGVSKLSDYISAKGECSRGQARLLADPKYFSDSKLIKTFHYAPSEIVHNLRQVFLDRLKDVLKPILGDKSKLRFVIENN